MISLDQVLLLQKKVETAVEKINFLTGQVEQLKNDNDALRTKCAELTKALDEKTELVSSLEVNQGQIEEGILTALNRLDTVENAILDGSNGNASLNEGSDGLTAVTESSDEEVEDDDTAAFDYTGGAGSEEASQELKEVTEEIADATDSSQDVQISEAAEADNTVSSTTDDQINQNQQNTEGENSENKAQDADSLNGQFDIF